MTVRITPMTEAETACAATADGEPEAGLGALSTRRGNLPLACLDVRRRSPASRAGWS